MAFASVTPVDGTGLAVDVVLEGALNTGLGGTTAGVFFPPPQTPFTIDFAALDRNPNLDLDAACFGSSLPIKVVYSKRRRQSVRK